MYPGNVMNCCSQYWVTGSVPHLHWICPNHAFWSRSHQTFSWFKDRYLHTNITKREIVDLLLEWINIYKHKWKLLKTRDQKVLQKKFCRKKGKRSKTGFTGWRWSYFPLGLSVYSEWLGRKGRLLGWVYHIRVSSIGLTNSQRWRAQLYRIARSHKNLEIFTKLKHLSWL